MRKILQIIRENTNAAEDLYPDTATIVREAVAAGVAEAKVREARQILKERGSIYSPKGDRYAAV
jgi:DNA replicative helicase MCM subunit Mcm2 (Cdc46/Mcm family)